MIKKIRCIFSVARSEYVRWVTDPRIITVGILIIFMKSLAAEPLLERAEKLGCSLDILEPFAAVGNSGMLVMLMPCVFLLLISDYPKMTGNSLFCIQRTGRFCWFCGQLLFLIYAIGTFLSAVLIGNILVSKGEFTGKWSDVVTKYNALYPNEANNFASQLLPSNLYNQIPLVSTVIQTMLLMGAYLFLLSLIIYLFKQLHLQTFGLFAAVVVVACGVVTCSIRSKLMWRFPMANTIIWLHYSEILKKPITPIWHSYLYFAILIAAVMLMNLIALKRLQFINIEQVE